MQRERFECGCRHGLAPTDIFPMFVMVIVRSFVRESPLVRSESDKMSFAPANPEARETQFVF